MHAFLFEQYGYYPKDFVDNSFSVDGWDFKLIEIDSENAMIEQMNEYLKTIRNVFERKGAFFIKNRSGELVSFHDNKKYVLVSIKSGMFSQKDVISFHCSLTEPLKTVNLKDVLSVWQERLRFIEETTINSIRVDSFYYQSNLEIAMFCIGLTQNAIQYLSDVVQDYGAEISSLSVVHKRIINQNSFDFFNPFNMIVDHPVKDMAELYKNDIFPFEEIVEMLNVYSLDDKLASIFIARLLYPTAVLDLLEDNLEQRSVGFNLKYSVEKELNKLKKMYGYIKKIYNVRHVDWLDV